LPVVVAPKNVALQVAVAVADAFDVPGGGDRSMRGSALRFDRQAVHLPEIDLPVVVAPKNVALAVAVEISDILDVPVVGHRSVHDRALGGDRQPVHLPDVDLPAVVAPKNVAVQVAVSRRCFRCASRWGRARAPERPLL